MGNFPLPVEDAGVARTGDDAIVVEHLTKRFRVYSERNQTVKAALLKRRRASYEEFVAVDDVSFSVPCGSTFGIIGSNGSGKSTTLKVLAQILEPDGGKVTVNGRVSALLELGAGFHPELSGRENIFLNAAILGIGRRQIQKSFDDILDFSGLHDFIDNPVKTYSSGMYARLGFSVAVNVDPDILLIDEVLAVGDETFQRRCSEKIAELRSGGRTVVIVSHGLASVQSLCDRAIWIDKGKLKAEGTPNYVIDTYLRSVHPQASIDAKGNVHTGVGGVRVESVEVLTSDEPETANRPTGFRITWNADEDIDRAALAIHLRRIDGVHVATSTDSRLILDNAIRRGKGSAICTPTSLPLMPGTYEVDGAIFDPQSHVVFDHFGHAARFDVSLGPGAEISAGLIDISASWERS